MQNRTVWTGKITAGSGLLILIFVSASFSVIAQRSATGFSIKSKSFLDQKKFKEALLYADSAVLHAKQIDNPDSLAQSYRWRSGVRTAMQDYKNALEDYMFAEDYSARSRSD